MKQRELIESPILKQLIDKNGVIQIITDYKDVYNGYLTLGYTGEEYYKECIPYNSYAKRFSTILRYLYKTDETIQQITLGCSGRNNYVEMMISGYSLEEFIELVQKMDRV